MNVIIRKDLINHNIKLYSAMSIPVKHFTGSSYPHKIIYKKDIISP